IEILLRRQLADSTRGGVMLPGILQSAQQKSETPAAMRETDAEFPRQFVEDPAENHRYYVKLRFRRHFYGPWHHVFWHPGLAQHVPGMHQHSRALLGTMLEKRDDRGMVQIIFPDVIPDLHL